MDAITATAATTCDRNGPPGSTHRCRGPERSDVWSGRRARLWTRPFRVHTVPAPRLDGAHPLRTCALRVAIGGRRIVTTNDLELRTLDGNTTASLQYIRNKSRTASNELAIVRACKVPKVRLMVLRCWWHGFVVAPHLRTPVTCGAWRAHRLVGIKWVVVGYIRFDYSAGAEW